MLNWGLLSTYRQALMGGSILLIMLYHSFHESSNGTITRFFVTGKMGVELFLILSGIGIYYSLSKCDSLLVFYKKRILRILPEYLLVSLPIYLVLTVYKGDTIWNFILNISMLNFLWGEGAYFWFVHLIIVCYLIAPFYFKLHTKEVLYKSMPLIVLLMSYIISYYYPAYQMILPRYAAFILGMTLGQFVMNNNVIPLGRIIVWAWPFVVTLLYLSTYKGECYGLWIEPIYYFFFSIPLMIYMTLLLFKNARVCSIFGFLGSISLELYLLHEIFFLKVAKMFFYNDIVICIVSIITAVPFAFLLSMINSYILKWINK